jgi:DNA-binding transcriptional regulator/RsmH inhibitor MraZ
LAGGLVHDPFSPDSKLADSPVLTTVFTMQSTTEKKFAAVEEKLAELSGLGKKLKKLEKEVASLSKKIEAPKDWRLMVGRLADTKIAREAVALGAEIRRKQTDL